MKDIIIKGEQLKKEIIIWLICFAAAECVNVYSIIKYNTEWIELLTQLHFAIAVSVLFYLIVFLVRRLISLIKRRKKIIS